MAPKLDIRKTGVTPVEDAAEDTEPEDDDSVMDSETTDSHSDQPIKPEIFDVESEVSFGSPKLPANTGITSLIFKFLGVMFFV